MRRRTNTGSQVAGKSDAIIICASYGDLKELDVGDALTSPCKVFCTKKIRQPGYVVYVILPRGNPNSPSFGPSNRSQTVTYPHYVRFEK